MKKYILATFFLVAFTLTLEPARNLMSKFLKLEQPQYHQIQEGEWLSKIAIKYYGDASFWRELELINRAPNGDKIYPGERIIVPSHEAMLELRRTQRLSTVNDLIQTQEQIIASGGYQEERRPVTEPAEEAEPAVTSAPEEYETVTPEDEEIASPEQEEEAPLVANNEPTVTEPEYFMEDTDFGAETSKSTTFLYIVGAAILILVLGVVFYVRKKKSEEVEYYGDVQPEEVKEEDKEETEKESEPYNFRQSLYSTEKEEHDEDEEDKEDNQKSRKGEKVNEKEFVS